MKLELDRPEDISSTPEGAFPTLTDGNIISGYQKYKSVEDANERKKLSKALGKTQFTLNDSGNAMLMDDEGTQYEAPPGLQGQILGNQIAQKYDEARVRQHFDKLRSGDPNIIKSAAIGGFPKPTGVLAGPGWRARSGTMRGLMLANQASKKVR